ncbi:hypothetical protein GCWU000341_02072 [Oribacterium sp. oral taxon 078 str. F0262]|nr:hypothetical protein [Oribacterium sp. oral taxon 078]EFE90965.1 hypothetical protein GCWU000341_02072 [Oribacterium sp. oral taxon 078 str. F0262]
MLNNYPGVRREKRREMSELLVNVVLAVSWAVQIEQGVLKEMLLD